MAKFTTKKHFNCFKLYYFKDFFNDFSIHLRLLPLEMLGDAIVRTTLENVAILTTKIRKDIFGGYFLVNMHYSVLYSRIL